ncbi:MAG: hypothetical protein M1330_00245 [Armatimonadetes bacterium]|nr:hypothetical protein [Armatimonadota bacterium]
MGIGPTDRIQAPVPTPPDTLRKVERDSDVRDDEEQRPDTPYNGKKQTENGDDKVAVDRVEVSEEYKKAAQPNEDEDDESQDEEKEAPVPHVDIQA